MSARPNSPKPTSSPTMPAIKYAIPMATAKPGSTHCWADCFLVSFVVIEDLLHDQFEVARDGQGQRQRRQIATGLDRVDRLPGHPQHRGQGGLGHATFLAEGAYSVAHHRTAPVSSMLVTWPSLRRREPDVKQACHADRPAVRRRPLPSARIVTIPHRPVN